MPRTAARATFLSSALFAGLAPAVAEAGVYAAPAIRWSSFAFRPEADEPTPNYYAYGASAALGYSVGQILDLGAFYTYIPARLGSPALKPPSATLDAYGGELGLRIADSVYIGFRGGQARYSLMKQTRPEEVPGKAKGSAGSVAIGAVMRTAKQSFFQTSLEVLHTVLEPVDSEKGKRRIDAFSLSVAWVYNAHKSFRFEDTVFRDFLNTLSFF